MKKWLIAFIIILGIILISIVVIRFVSGEDSWICSNGSWVKHGQPSDPMPTTKCGEGAIQKTTTLTNPAAGALVVSPLNIAGIMPGSWFFEATAQVALYDANGKLLAKGAATTSKDWMTSDPLPFGATLTFETPTTETGTLVLMNDNPSGLPANAKQESYPIKFGKATATNTTVKAFFGNGQLNPDLIDCSKVFSVDRTIPTTTAVGRAALEELLKGPSVSEKTAGYITGINSGVKINSLTIANGTAKVDFNSQLGYQVGGSCLVSEIRSQIEQTLKQFSTVTNVIISIDGNTTDILQP